MCDCLFGGGLGGLGLSVRDRELRASKICRNWSWVWSHLDFSSCRSSERTSRRCWTDMSKGRSGPAAPCWLKVSASFDLASLMVCLEGVREKRARKRFPVHLSSGVVRAQRALLRHLYRAPKRVLKGLQSYERSGQVLSSTFLWTCPYVDHVEHS